MSGARLTTGRLVEITVGGSYRTLEDIDALFTQVSAAFATTGSRVPFVVVADFRGCQVFSADGAEHFVEHMVRLNGKIERSGQLLDPNAPSMVLQANRMVRETRFAHRKSFLELRDIYRWLDPVLTSPEQTRLREYLKGAPHTPLPTSR